MGKIHYLDLDHDSKIPRDYRTGKGTICGYQRQEATLNKENVTCKLCLREMKKKKLITT
ncbi:hypothetical protein [Clostridium botulinum]|uniref:hypothetical protein n=1 Tax=Clostridium botulinum TaxID=1491 RepID=UPI00036B0E04|nr:hypothetical protein [Clostridium botulinum]